MARRWLLPLAALSEIPDFNRTTIPSEDHYQITADTYESVWPWRSYKTSPHSPPHMEITRHGGELSNGYVFLTPSNTKGKEGTYELSGTGFIMTTEGDMIFAGEESGYSFCNEWVAGMTDFRKQDYDGRPHITYWNGCNTQGAHWGHRWGRVTFIDEEYTNFTVNPDFDINTLDPVNKGQIDVHEHQMTDDGTMVVTSYNNTQEDMSMIGGSNETWVAESMFFEFDVKTGDVLFKWRAMDHTPFSASRWGLGPNRGTQHVPWDWFHINSVQKVGKNYLISSRHHWAAYLISGEDGSVIWKLDGEDGGSFGWIPTRFRWQHHVRAQNISEHGMTVSVFNNQVNGAQNENTQSQALAFYLPLPASPDNPPRLVRQMQTPDEMIFSATQGSYQMDLGNGNGFVDYGKVPLVREYGPAGDGSDLRWQAWFGHDGSAMSYRAFKAEWHGIPKDWDPVAIFEPVRLQRIAPAKVFVSWNGATDISDWAVFAGDDREDLKSIGVVKKMGFETTFQLGTAQCVQLGAIRDGKIIRASNVACQDDDIPPGQGGRTGISELQSEKEKLEAEIQDLEHNIDELESGVWVSYRLFAEVACSVVVIVAAIWSYKFWRERRRRTAYQGVLGTESYYQHSPLNPDLSLGVFSVSRNKHKVSPMIPTDAAEFDERKLDEGAASGRQHRGTDEEPFGLAEEDEEDEDEESPPNSRTPFMRQSNGS